MTQSEDISEAVNLKMEELRRRFTTMYTEIEGLKKQLIGKNMKNEELYQELQALQGRQRNLINKIKRLEKANQKLNTQILENKALSQGNRDLLARLEGLNNKIKEQDKAIKSPQNQVKLNPLNLNPDPNPKPPAPAPDPDLPPPPAPAPEVTPRPAGVSVGGVGVNKDNILYVICTDKEKVGVAGKSKLHFQAIDCGSAQKRNYFKKIIEESVVEKRSEVAEGVADGLIKNVDENAIIHVNEDGFLKIKEAIAESEKPASSSASAALLPESKTATETNTIQQTIINYNKSKEESGQIKPQKLVEFNIVNEIRVITFNTKDAFLDLDVGEDFKIRLQVKKPRISAMKNDSILDDADKQRSQVRFKDIIDRFEKEFGEMGTIKFYGPDGKELTDMKKTNIDQFKKSCGVSEGGKTLMG